MKVIIWGCGTIGKRVFIPLIENHHMEIIAYTDSSQNMWGGNLYNTPIVQPFKIKELQYDYILIAVYDFEKIHEINEQLVQMDIPLEKIKAIVLEREFIDVFMDQRMYWIKDFARYTYKQKLEGSVAECGVFRGDSAKYINKFFPDKKLLLFDTFEGFDEKDIEYEKSLNNQSYNHSKFTCKELFAKTSIDLLMKKMENPGNVKIYKGCFPKTTQGIEDKFLFVNLDMDLYQPMLEGLRFFLPRLVSGGCILLHDYYHPELPGVELAVADYERELGNILVKFPIGDDCSVAIIKC